MKRLNFTMIELQVLVMLLTFPIYTEYRGDFCEPFGRKEFCEYLGDFFLIIPSLIIACKIIHLLIYYITSLEAFERLISSISRLRGIFQQSADEA